jgi:hypothetical protein
MLSELQQKDVWEGWLGAEIRANYFADLCGRYRTEQKTLTWLILVSSSGSLIALLSDQLPQWQWVKPVLAFLAAGASLYLLIQQNQKGSTDSADLHSRWATLANQYRALWDDMYSGDAVEKLRELEEKEIELSKSSTAFPNNERKMLKWQNHVQKHHHLATSA